MHWLRTMVVPALGIVLMGAMPAAADDDCKPVFEALNKVMKVPTHIFSTTSVDGKPKTTESIYTEDGVFTNASGKWTLSAMKREQVGLQELENRKKGDNSCRFVKEEILNGEKAAVYTTRSTNPDQKTEGQIWISTSKGLPLRNEVDLLSGVKNGIRSHYSVRYEYNHVAPPKL